MSGRDLLLLSCAHPIVFFLEGLPSTVSWLLLTFSSCMVPTIIDLSLEAAAPGPACRPAMAKRTKRQRQRPKARDLPQELELHEVDLTSLHHVTESRALLRYLTRLLFASVMLSCAVVMTTSLLLLLKCRREVKGLEEAVECGHGHCSSQSLPAYFTLLVLFVVTFGLGCVGRRVTGALLVAVSLVAVAVAAATALTQDCVDDLSSVRESLVHKLQQCGLYRTGTSAAPAGSLQAGLFHRFQEPPAATLHTEACRALAVSFDLICQEGVAAGQPVNETRLGGCAREVAAKLHELCAQDTEVVLPVLITLPVFYVFVGLGFVLIKHADDRMALRQHGCSSALRSRATSTHQQRASTTDSPSSSAGPACRRLLATCLEWLFTRSPWCFSCYVKGQPCRCCTALLSSSASSRQSFAHMQDNEQAEAEAALHVPLRISQSRERNERKYLMEQSV